MAVFRFKTNRLKMETDLQLCNSNSKYPEHFQRFLNNCVKCFPDNFLANDYLFAAVYFVLLETGFTSEDSTGKLDTHHSVSFDIRKLRATTLYPNEQLKRMKKCIRPKCHIYNIAMTLGNTSHECELQGVPSFEMNNHLIINFLSKEHHIVRSLCLSTDYYTTAVDDPIHKFELKNLGELSMLVKNKISTHIKDLILQDTEQGCYANLLRLPEDVQLRIVHFLKDDPVSVQLLGTTCSYFYNLISNDSKLWEHICFKQFHGRELNTAINELVSTPETSGSNLFKEVFLLLKLKESRYYYR